MKIYREGEKGRAICDRDGLAATTFRYRDVPFGDGSGVVRNILVAVCDACGAVLAMPPQSMPAVKAARDLAAVSLEANLPAVYVDALDLALYRIDAGLTSDFRKQLLLLYLHETAGDAALIAALPQALHEARAALEQESGGSVRRRLSMKLTASASGEVESITRATGLTKTDLVKAMIGGIHRDIVAPEKPRNMKLLRTLAAVAA